MLMSRSLLLYVLRTTAVLALFCGVLTYELTHSSPQLHCSPVQPFQSQSDCRPTPDGRGLQCSFGDIPPNRWGQCLEDTKREFTCLKHNMIAHYDGNQPFPKWRVKANACPALAAQLKHGGTDSKEFTVPLPLPEQSNKKDPRI